jgi:hypothetical protein
VNDGLASGHRAELGKFTPSLPVAAAISMSHPVSATRGFQQNGGVYVGLTVRTSESVTLGLAYGKTSGARELRLRPRGLPPARGQLLGVRLDQARPLLRLGRRDDRRHQIQRHPSQHRARTARTYGNREHGGSNARPS